MCDVWRAGTLMHQTRSFEIFGDSCVLAFVLERRESCDVHGKRSPQLSYSARWRRRGRHRSRSFASWQQRLCERGPKAMVLPHAPRARRHWRKVDVDCPTTSAAVHRHGLRHVFRGHSGRKGVGLVDQLGSCDGSAVGDFSGSIVLVIDTYL